MHVQSSSRLAQQPSPGASHVEVRRQALDANTQVTRLNGNVELLGTHALRNKYKNADLAASAGAKGVDGRQRAQRQLSAGVAVPVVTTASAFHIGVCSCPV